MHAARDRLVGLYVAARRDPGGKMRWEQQMTATKAVCLVDLEGSGLQLAHASDDVRGLTVVDPHGHRVGEVDGLVIDEEERRVRLLVVASGGILGLGRTNRMVPVDAVSWVDDVVVVETSHERIHEGNGYETDRVQSPRYDEVYAHFGYLPFWGPTYVDPYFIRRP